MLILGQFVLLWQKISTGLSIALGAVLGSWSRTKLIDHYGNIFQRNYLGTLVVNLASTFALGFFIGVTICLYAYISNTGDVQATLTKPSATITGFVAD